MMQKRIALHPGWVTGQDGGSHFIGVFQLARLYGLGPSDYIVWEPHIAAGRRWEDYTHLMPDMFGEYDLVRRIINGTKQGTKAKAR